MLQYDFEIICPSILLPTSSVSTMSLPNTTRIQAALPRSVRQNSNKKIPCDVKHSIVNRGDAEYVSTVVMFPNYG
jgi:hypothetical protein